MATAKTQALDLDQPKMQAPVTPPKTVKSTVLPALVRNPPQTAMRHDLVASVPDRMRTAPLRMDKKTFTQMTRGKKKPEGRLDLHGMTLDRAHPALLRFVMGSHAAGKRLILVITGKGKERDEGGPIPVRYGVLRHQVPQWLALAPLSSVVLQVTPAHLSHGGGGAYYVFLKRTR